MKKIVNYLLCLLLTLGFSFAQKKQTYKNNGTTYYSNETYSTTGQPKVKRSTTAKKEFLESKGYDKVPDGKQVDHIVPLSQGGTDKPENMQLITTEEHKIKTANERKEVSKTNSTFNNPTYNSNSTHSTPSYKSTSTNTQNTIYTGSKGGQYYYNSKGNKTYIKRR